jgi:transcriptional regulator with XRE-family HTH domain
VGKVVTRAAIGSTSTDRTKKPKTIPGGRREHAQAASRERVDHTLLQALGSQVKSLRQSMNLTASDAARAAGMSVGMLSRIEHGHTAASLATLQQLALALNVPMTAFFTKYDQKFDATFVKAGQGLTIDRRGTRAGHRYELLGHSLRSQLKIEPFLITLDHSSDAYPVFQHSGYEFIYMLAGEVTYRHADKSYLLRPGDSLFFDAEAPHGPQDLRKLPARFLSVIVYQEAAQNS